MERFRDKRRFVGWIQGWRFCWIAAAVVLASASVSGLIVRHKLDHLDLVEVLKTRE